jgi:cephalosporin hydroxylase
VDYFQKFKKECAERVKGYNSSKMKYYSDGFMEHSISNQYSYNFFWLDRPIIQYPQDIVAMQELIWDIKPDLIVETGIAHGGSLVFNASMLALLDLCEYGYAETKPNLSKPRRVIGVDIDIRPHNRKILEKHPFYPRMTLIEGSSVEANIIDQVYKASKGSQNILVCLDSNHTHDHVLRELEAYAPLTSKNSYCVVFDGIAEDLPEGFIGTQIDNRPWDKGDNPKTAVREYLGKLGSDQKFAVDGKPLNFKINKTLEAKLQTTVVSDGFLQRIEP